MLNMLAATTNFDLIKELDKKGVSLRDYFLNILREEYKKKSSFNEENTTFLVGNPSLDFLNEEPDLYENF